MTYSSWLAALLAATFLLRLVLAASTGLGIDESYMVAAGRELAWGYFDHPPLSWWLSAGATRLAGSEAALVVRLPFIALFALSTWLMYRLTTALFDKRAGLWAAVGLNLSPVFGVTTGMWVLPDGPLVAALLGFALCLHHALEAGRWRWWIGAGICAGLALLSKYSAVLNLAGALVVMLTLGRAWLARPQPWVAGLVALAVFAPVLLWNATHGWASFAFQGARAGVARLNLAGPLTTLGGEALFLLPWLWLPMVALWLVALRRGPAARPGWFLAWLGFGPIVLFVVVSLWSPRVLFHWGAPGYLFLFPLLGQWVGRQLDHRPVLARRAIAGTALFLLAGLALGAAELRLNLLALRGDPLRQGLDWTPLAGALAARGLLAENLAAPSWADAGKLDYALGGAPRVVCLNIDCRQFGFHRRTARDLVGQDLLILAPRQDAARIAADYARLFDRIEPLPPAVFALPGRPHVEIGLYRGHRLRAWPP